MSQMTQARGERRERSVLERKPPVKGSEGQERKMSGVRQGVSWDDWEALARWINTR